MRIDTGYCPVSAVALHFLLKCIESASCHFWAALFTDGWIRRKMMVWSCEKLQLVALKCCQVIGSFLEFINLDAFFCIPTPAHYSRVVFLFLFLQHGKDVSWVTFLLARCVTTASSRSCINFTGSSWLCFVWNVLLCLLFTNVYKYRILWFKAIFSVILKNNYLIQIASANTVYLWLEIT